MPKKAYTPEQTINKLREAEVLLSQGVTLTVIWKKIGVSDCTYYRWRKEYGGMRIEQAKPEPLSGTTHLHPLMRNGLPRRLLHWQLNMDGMATGVCRLCFCREGTGRGQTLDKCKMWD